MQAALEEANSACHDLRLEAKRLVKEAKENQIADDCKQQDIEEYIHEFGGKSEGTGAAHGHRTQAFSH